MNWICGLRLTTVDVMKYAIGTKVKLPITKSVGCRIEKDTMIGRAKQIGQDHAFIVGYDKYAGVNVYILSRYPNCTSGNYFSESDIEPYNMSWRERLK